MKNLWFKQYYVLPILNGSKTDTIRRQSSRLPDIDEVVSFSVGPIKPFCTARIIAKEIIDLKNIFDERRKELLSIYPGYSASLVRLTYKLESAG